MGRAGTRQLLGVETVPTPPYGHTVVRFRTDYARRPGAIETMSLTQEGGAWRVTGIVID